LKIKLGCKYQTEVELKGPGISWTNHYNCISLDFPIPQDNDDIHSLNCPICNEPIKITITGKQTAKVKRKTFLSLGIIIFLPFLYWIYNYIHNQGFNIYGILIIIFLGIFFSGYPFLKVIADDFYKEATVFGGQHKILKNQK
jgi:hypothetical protein